MKKSNTYYLKQVGDVYGGKYDLSKIEYGGSKSKIIIGCYTHGWFTQRCDKFLGGRGCVICNKEKNKISIQGYLERANIVHIFKYKYPFIMSEYKDIKSELTIKCPLHGLFVQKADIHLNNSGCRICSGREILHSSVIKKAYDIHIGKYKYKYRIGDKTIFMKSKIEIICLSHSHSHGTFEQSADNHITKKHGCPKCNSSKGENRIGQYLKKNDIIFEVEKTFDDLKYKSYLRFDFYLPKYNMCIEYDGIQHFEAVEYFGGQEMFIKTKHKDKLKTNYCEEKGIKLLRIPYNDFENIKTILKTNHII